MRQTIGYMSEVGLQEDERRHLENLMKVYDVTVGYIMPVMDV